MRDPAGFFGPNYSNHYSNRYSNRVSCVKELAGLDLDIAGLRTCTFGLRLVRISPNWVSATAQVTVVAAGSSRPRRYVKGSLPYAHPLGVVVNRPSVWPDR
jgi:hypothetical protein